MCLKKLTFLNEKIGEHAFYSKITEVIFYVL